MTPSIRDDGTKASSPHVRTVRGVGRGVGASSATGSPPGPRIVRTAQPTISAAYPAKPTDQASRCDARLSCGSIRNG